VFKKETGESFISYLTDYRMKEAARLLLETDEKNYTIAGKVGCYYSRGKVPRAAKSRPPCREIATIPQLLSR
jgi:AraC-like DNA-binding protein